ncbi:MAG: ComEA family DNA-binding protein [Chitinophagales bacterium]
MKKLLLILFISNYPLFAFSQDIPPTTEQQLENLVDADQVETEDDSYLLQLEQFRKNPINLNTADEMELGELRIVTDLQIQNLLSYRKLFGKLIDIYELQAVPSWDLITIRKLLPFITVAVPVSIKEEAGHRLRKGDHTVLLRGSQTLEQSKGFDKSATGTKYLGSPQRIFFRYRYNYKNLLQFGIVADKDAGEQFFKGAQKKGFDFYSFHLFAGRIGSIQAIALGDFTVNMGQGLIQWQSLAVKKSSDITGVKRQSQVLRPYNSAGEYNFHRGVGITIKRANIEATAFGSIRKLNANFTVDTVNHEDFISSFLTSGNNRTTPEIADRNRLKQTTFGGNIKYRAYLPGRLGGRWHIGINAIYYRFSVPVNKTDDPYNTYALNGNKGYNFSADYSFTFRNFHFFGEAAAGKNFRKAFLNGLLISVDPRVDLSVVYRTIDKEYQAINGNAFTENTSPGNETGLYAGITIRPADAWRLDAYGDVYKFPWLRYLADAPSYGKDFLVQLIYVPNKQVEVYIRHRNETKQGNRPDNLLSRQARTNITNYLVQLSKQNWRMQVSYKINAAIVLRNRVEIIWYDKRGDKSENGFLSFFDLIYKPMMKPYSGLLRLQYFETDGYNSRLYAYENDVLYSYSIPVFYDKGYRYYLTLNYDITKKLSCWLRWAQTIYRDKSLIGSGLDEIDGNKRTEVKLQLRIIF